MHLKIFIFPQAQTGKPKRQASRRLRSNDAGSRKYMFTLKHLTPALVECVAYTYTLYLPSFTPESEHVT